MAGLGSLCLVDEVGDFNETLMLYDRASSAVTASLFEGASLTAVQAFLLLGNFAQKVSGTVERRVGILRLFVR